MRKTEIEEDTDYGTQISVKVLPNGRAMMFYIGAITPTFVSDIAGVLSEYEYVDCMLFLQSPGGDASQITVSYPIFKSLGISSIIGFGQCSSAALAILLEAKKHIPVFMDRLTHIVLHRCMTTTVLEERYDRIAKFNESFVKTFEEMFDKINAPVIKKLTAETKRIYKSGNNVYLFGSNLIDWKIFKEFTQKEMKSLQEIYGALEKELEKE